MNHEHIAGGSSVYEVINQYSALKTDENRKAPARDRRGRKNKKNVWNKTVKINVKNETD